MKRKHSWTRRGISLLLAFVTALTLVPSSAYATDMEGESGSEENLGAGKPAVSVNWEPQEKEVKTGETGTVRLTAQTEGNDLPGLQTKVEITLDQKEAAALQEISGDQVDREDQSDGSARLTFTLEGTGVSLDSSLSFETEAGTTAPFQIQVDKEDIAVSVTQNGTETEADIEKQGGTMQVAASFAWDGSLSAETESFSPEEGGDLAFDLSLTSANRKETGTLFTGSQEILLTLTLPESLSFLDGTYKEIETDEQKAIVNGEGKKVLAGLPQDMEVTEVNRTDSQTLTVKMSRENPDSGREMEDLSAQLTVSLEGIQAEPAYTPEDGAAITLKAAEHSISVAGKDCESSGEWSASVPVTEEAGTESPQAEPGEESAGEETAEAEKARDTQFQLPTGSTVAITGRADAITHQIYWADNNNEANKRSPAGAEGDYPRAALSFTVKDSDGNPVGSGVLDESNKNALGMTRLPNVQVVDRGSSHYEYAVETGVLPSQILVTDIYGVETSYKVEWTAVPQEVNGYALVEVTEENQDDYPSINGQLGWYYMLETDFTFQIDLHCGTVEAATDKIRERLTEQFELNLSYGAGKSQSFKLDDIGEVNFSVTEVEDHPTNNALWEGTISGLWKYNLDGSLIHANVAEINSEKNPADGKLDVPDSTILGEGDYFAISYDNADAPNYGAVTDCIHDGGTLDLTLAGETEFTATKEWLDNDVAYERPNGEFQLWRYRKGSDYTTAAAVRDSKNEIMTIKLDGKDPQGISFSDLPKYDPEGYEYVYVVREYLENGGNYTQVFGEVTENGDGTFTTKDTGEDGKAYEDRPARDTFVYQDGTLSNRITGTKETEAVKIWKASAFQAEFDEVSVELTLMCRPENDEDAQWTEAKRDGNVVREVLEDFTAETLSATSVDASMPAYDELGRPLEYQWVETGVYQGDSTENLLKDGQFTLEQDGREITYRSESVSEGTEDGVSQTTVTNSIANTVDYEVEKIWEEGTTPGEVTFFLYRILSGQTLTEDTKPVVTFTLDGNEDPDRTLVNKEEGIYMQEIAPWKADLTGLPEYDEDGREYEYILLENTEGTEYYPTYNTTRDEKTRDYYTEVINGPGTNNRILVRKDWIDDSDILHRKPVTIGVYTRNGNVRIAEVTLEGDVWQAQVGIGKYKTDEVYILEEKVGDTTLDLSETDTPKEPECPGFYDDEGAAGYTAIRYETEHHHYEATYYSPMEIAGETVYSVTNRRLGNVNLTATKEWVDGDGERRDEIQAELARLKDEKRVDLSLNLKLVFADNIDSSGYEIYYEENTVSIGNRDDQVQIMQPVIRDDGLTEEDETKPGSAIVKVDLEKDSFTCYFWNLPKYDQHGSVVRYSVEEVWLDGDGKEVPLEEMKTDYPELYALVAEYSVSYEETFATSDKHDVDDQTVTVTNKLTGSKEVRWHKQWNDMYNNENGRRPDIYLDIYAVKHEKTEGTELPTEKTELYLANYKWEYSDYADDTENNQDGRYDKERHWHAVLSGLPKYDDYGYEIIYYAVEHTLVNATDFDYTDTVYSVDDEDEAEGLREIGTVNQIETSEIEAGNAVKIPNETGDLDPSAESTYTLREEGTFTNNLSGTASITGRKLWQNLPAGYPKEDMPAIRFRLEQYVKVNKWNQDQDTDDGQVLINEKCATLTVTDWTSIYKNGSYTFEINYAGENEMTVGDDGTASFGPAGKDQEKLPRYDEMGNLYIYKLVEDEILWDEKADPDSGLTIDDVYEKDDSSNTYLVNNTYGGQKEALSWQKYLYLPTDDQGNQVYPAVLFNLIRTYTKNDGSKSEPEVAEVYTWTSEQVKEAYEKAGSPDTGLVHGVFTLEDQEVYAPNGSRYEYQICEMKTYLNDFDTWTSEGDLEEKGLADVMKGEPAKKDKDNRIPVVIELKPNQNEGTGDTAESVPVTATFINRRTDNPTTVELTGNKIWEDYGDAFGTRPEDVTLKVFRSAPSQPGQGNGINEQEVAESSYKISWEKPENSNTWTYTITGKSGSNELERYAPNGRPWWYVVREYLEDGSVYEVRPANGQVSEKTQDTDAATSQMNDLTNSMETDVPFRKEWIDSEGEAITEDYLSYDLAIDFKLQVAEVTATETGGETSYTVGEWRDASQYMEEKLSPDDYNTIFGNGFEFTKPLSGRINDPDWGQGDTFQDLPRTITKTDEGNVRLIYRAVESEIRYGTTTITVSVENSEDNRTYTYKFSSESLFSPAYAEGESNNAGTSTHVNRLGSTGLKVTKQWEGDRNNAYSTRPETDKSDADWETIFVIQRSTDPNDKDSWTNVTDGGENGKALIVYVTGTNQDDSASATVTGLPAQDADGKDYHYRARELQPAEDRYIDGQVDKVDIVEDQGTYYSTYRAEYADDMTGNVTTATNSLESTKVYAKKNWHGTPADSVNMELQYLAADGKTWTSFNSKAKVELDGMKDENPGKPYYEYDKWQAVWDAVPAAYPGSDLSKDGKTQYRVVETLPGGYIQIQSDEGTKEEDDQTYPEWSFTNVATTSLTVTKSWYEIPANERKAVTVELWRTTGAIEGDKGEQVEDKDGNFQTLTLTAAGKWEGTFQNLPKYDENGALYTYYAVETEIGGQPAEDTGYRIVYTHTGSGKDGFTTSIANIGRTELTGTKTWKDNGNAYDTRPKELELKLSRSIDDGKTWVEVTEQIMKQEGIILVWSSTDTNQWTYEYQNLPAADDSGKSYQYKVEEVTPQTGVADDTYVGTAAENGTDFTNTLTGKVDIPVTKIWQDGGNVDGERPKEVTLILYADGAEKARITLKAADYADGQDPDRWSHTFTDLDEYDSNGKRIVYTVEEEGVPDGYEATGDPGSRQVTNVLLTSLSVRKVWGGVAEEEQTEVTVGLYRSVSGQAEEPVLSADGAQLTLALTEDANWIGTFTGLPRFDEAGNRYEYTVKELTVGGQPAEESDYIIHVGKDGNGAVVSNIAKTFLTGVKIWQDDQNAYGTRPETLELTLWRQVEGEEPEKTGEEPVWEGTGEDTWTYTFESLPVTDDEGHPYTYWVEETVPEEYELVQQDNQLTNTLKDVIRIPVEKTWQDQNNLRGIRPASIEVILYADGQEAARAELSRDNSWKTAFEDLEEYDETGRRILYEVKEAQVPEGYKAVYQGSQEEGFRIENVREDIYYRKNDPAKTGDGAPVAGYAGLMLASGLAAAWAVSGKRRRKQR